MSELNIYQRINAIKEEQSIYIKKGSAGQGTGVQYDEVISVLAPLLCKYGVIITTDKYGESRARETKKGAYIYECDHKITYINVDKPDDKFETIIESHAQDGGDKAPGKAVTYATKVSILKVFSIESGDKEESRADAANTDVIDNGQVDTLYKLLVTPEGMLNPVGMKLSKAYKFAMISEIPAKKYDAILKKAQQ
ncbi:MAG: ERF family protein [Colwellia sp.]|nr:ERF family protein [Colwellia sp.]